MLEIMFYHLEHSKLEDVMPQLLQKSLERDWRAVIYTKDKAHLKYLDDYLWTFQNDSFLPHSAEQDGFEAQQPIWLSVEGAEPPNDPQVCFLTNNAAMPKDLSALERVIMLFDGNNQEAVQEARTQWKQLKENPDIQLTYWQQSSSGQWQKKA